MFEDGAKLDDILNVLERPPLIGNKNKQPITEAGFRYDSGQTSREEVQIEFAGQKNLGVIK